MSPRLLVEPSSKSGRAIEPMKERYYCQFINNKCIIQTRSDNQKSDYPAIMILLYLILPTFNNSLVSFDVVYSQGQIINDTSPSPSSSSSFQSKATTLDNMPSHNVTSVYALVNCNKTLKQLSKLF